MSKSPTTEQGKIPGEIVSFKIDRDVLKAARKQAFDQRISLSLWFRQAAYAKIRAAKRSGKPALA